MVESRPGVALVCLACSRVVNVLTDLPASKFMIDTGAGVVDADYRGVIFVLLINHSDKDFQGTPFQFLSLSSSNDVFQWRKVIESPSSSWNGYITQKSKR
jgi:hypothetical protein